MLRRCMILGFQRSPLSLLPISNMSSENTLKRPSEESSADEQHSKKLKDYEGTLTEMQETSNRIRKPKKVVLMLCYLGKNYSGMQRNHNVSTVEEELLKALLEAKVILKNEFEFPKTMKFQRAARTDKGVSAVRQIVSLKIPIDEIADSLRDKVNKYLPPEIRLIDVIRVTQSFDAKVACDARTYSYMLPTFAFSAGGEEHQELYRITEDRITDVNKFLQRYKGTHNFYNFTSGRLPGDPSCQRFIISCECSKPFELSGLEFVVVHVKGQSFMLHQIRKMVGLAIACMRNLADEAVLDKSWLKERLDIPKAPGLGLMLEELHYDWYNTKYGNDGMHRALEWSPYDELINKFKTEQICANIAETEKEEKSMLQWLETLPFHSFDVREAAPPEVVRARMARNTGTKCSEADQIAETEDAETNHIPETKDMETDQVPERIGSETDQVTETRDSETNQIPKTKDPETLPSDQIADTKLQSAEETQHVDSSGKVAAGPEDGCHDNVEIEEGKTLCKKV